MMAFLSPLLVWGTLLGAIPLIIHLLNRRRFRRVEWAPMRYLKLTIQRNRRRVQIEQLLLLLLRIALPVLLFLFLARPVLRPTGLERWLGSGGRSSQVVLIDDSLSMGYAAGEAPAFGRAREMAAALLASVRPQDRCTIVTTSAPRTPVLHEVEGSRREDLSGAALGVPLTATHSAWPIGAGGGRRGLAVLHVSDEAAHHHHRPAEVRVGCGRRHGRPTLERAGGQGPDRGRRRRRGRQRRAGGARPARPDRSSPAPRVAGRP